MPWPQCRSSATARRIASAASARARTQAAQPGAGLEFATHLRLFDRPDPRRLDLRASIANLRSEWLVRVNRQQAGDDRAPAGRCLRLDALRLAVQAGGRGRLRARRWARAPSASATPSAWRLRSPRAAGPAHRGVAAPRHGRDAGLAAAAQRRAAPAASKACATRRRCWADAAASCSWCPISSGPWPGWTTCWTCWRPPTSCPCGLGPGRGGAACGRRAGGAARCGDRPQPHAVAAPCAARALARGRGRATCRPGPAVRRAWPAAFYLQGAFDAQALSNHLCEVQA